MKTFRQFLKENNLVDPWFDDWFKDVGKHKVVKKDPPQVVDYTLELYRGFDVDWNKVKKEGEFYILSPERSEQGLIWFTHKFIVHYDPIQYAASHGEWFLTYPLKCKRHIQKIHWSDGQTQEITPDDVLQKSEPTENSRYHMGIELPEGWVFSYKMEKFIGSSVKLRITKNMIRKSNEVRNEE